MHLEGDVVATASRVVGAMSTMLRLQAGVLSDGAFSPEDFIGARRSVQLESEMKGVQSPLVCSRTCVRK